jgi:hypothetical protein
MKKIFLFLALASLAITSCNNDDDNNSTTEEVSIETQNTYDDEAIQKFLKDNYFDSRGNIVAFSSTSVVLLLSSSLLHDVIAKEAKARNKNIFFISFLSFRFV